MSSIPYSTVLAFKKVLMEEPNLLEFIKLAQSTPADIVGALTDPFESKGAKESWGMYRAMLKLVATDLDTFKKSFPDKANKNVVSQALLLGAPVNKNHRLTRASSQRAISTAFSNLIKDLPSEVAVDLAMMLCEVACGGTKRYTSPIISTLLYTIISRGNEWGLKRKTTAKSLANNPQRPYLTKIIEAGYVTSYSLFQQVYFGNYEKIISTPDLLDLLTKHTNMPATDWALTLCKNPAILNNYNLFTKHIDNLTVKGKFAVAAQADYHRQSKLVQYIARTIDTSNLSSYEWRALLALNPSLVNSENYLVFVLSNSKVQPLTKKQLWNLSLSKY